MIDIINVVNKNKSGDFFDDFLDFDDVKKEIMDVERKSRYYYSNLNAVKKRIQIFYDNNDVFDVIGSLNYMMSLEEIKQKLHDIFRDIRIVKIDDINNDEWFTNGSENPTRITGAKYLNKKIVEDLSIFRVPEYIIGVRDDIKTLDIVLNLSGQHLMPSKISNGIIYSKRINGKESANRFANNMFLKKIGYVDTLGDAGNIIIESTSNIPYIVDTAQNLYKYYYFTLSNNCCTFNDIKQYYYTLICKY